MPLTPAYPGVYLDELPPTVRTITGVPTSVAAFVGAAARGPVDAPVHISSWADFEASFGGLDAGSPLSYAVYQYFANGGAEAEIVRVVAKDAAPAQIGLGGGAPVLEAASPGAWGDQLVVRVDWNTRDTSDANLYNLTVHDRGTGAEEQYLNVSTAATGAASLGTLLAGSRLVRVLTPSAQRPQPTNPPAASLTWFDDTNAHYAVTTAAAPSPDAPPVDADIIGSPDDKTGMYQLLKTDIFNLLCVPSNSDVDAAVWNAAAKLCLDRRAILLLDPPAAWNSANAAAALAVTPLVAGDPQRNAAIYFPNVIAPDLLQNSLPRRFPPCGVVAGVLARTDAQRGVWKAAAGTDAGLSGVTGLAVPLTDGDQGPLNELGVNCLRSFPVIGPVVWGARTTRGADRLADQWKYLPVRRTALFLEESLFRGTQWVVFEPNDEPLWSSIRLSVGSFMNTLFRQGAFQGATPREAYLVKCDHENNPQADIDRGIVNILVGFAPLKPAEFVFIHLQQLTADGS
jgi:uncharacterized protein